MTVGKHHTQNYRRRKDDTEIAANSIELSSPFGKLRVTSKDIMIVMMVMSLASIAFIGYMVYEHTHEFKHKDTEVAKSVEKGFNDMRKAQEQSTTVQSEMIYVMTLTIDQREKLRLDMPESLRNRARTGDGR